LEKIKAKGSGFVKPTKQEYGKMVKKASPPSPLFKNMSLAFLFGGTLCTLGEAIFQWTQMGGMEEKSARAVSSVALIFLSVLLTGLQVYDNLAKHAGAGMLVPITGFANAMSSPAIEFKTEGFVLGLGAKMFTIAGPVIVYGTVASVVYGIIYWITTLF
jgi:stage V sporulation protein AC